MNTISSINSKLSESNKRKFADLFSGSKNITVTVEWGTPGFSQIERLHDEEKDFASLINRYNMELEAIEAGFDMYRKIIDRSEGVCGVNFICTGTRDEALKTAEWIKNYVDKQGRLCQGG